MKNILLTIEGHDDKPLQAQVGVGPDGMWMHNARDCAYETSKHYGNSAVTVLDPDDNNAPVVRVKCEWLEADE